MIYLFLLSVVMFYLAVSHMTYKYTIQVRNDWYGEVTIDGQDLLFSLCWPLSLPIFRYVYKKEICYLKEGRDWADVHIKVEDRETFRNHCMKEAA